MFPSRRAAVLLLAQVVPLALAPWLPAVIQVVAAFDLVLVLLFLLEAPRHKGLVSIAIVRDHPPSISIGERSEVTLMVRNDSRRSLHLELKEDVDEHLGPDETHFQLVLRPAQRLGIAYWLTPNRRGLYHFGDVTVRMTTWLGLCVVQQPVSCSTQVRVFPNLVALRRFELAWRFKKLGILGFQRIRTEGIGDEFEKLREYLTDDNYRHIDWKAASRRLRPITRVYETERSQNVLLCVDSGRMMNSRVGQLSKLDFAINAALMLAYVALKNDDRVGLLAFSTDVQLFLPPGKGRAHFRMILKALCDLEAGLSFVDYRAMARFVMGRLRRRSLVVLFTDFLDEESARPLVRFSGLIGLRHLPLCVTLRDEDLQDLYGTEPTTEADVYRTVAAGEILRERHGCIQALRKQRVEVLDELPSRLDVRTVNKYLELKRRKML